MHIEIQVALNFVISYLYNKLPRRRVNLFGEELEKALKEKFVGHWYPEKPFKGSAFRCLKTGDPTDAVLDRAARESGVPIADILENLPSELSVWIDPGEVSYRIGEKGPVKILFSESNDSHEDYNADREVTKTFNPEAQCFRPIEIVSNGLNGLTLNSKPHHDVASNASSPMYNNNSSLVVVNGGGGGGGNGGGSGGGSSQKACNNAIDTSPAPTTSFLNRSQEPLTFTTATFAQTKFGSTKLKNNSKRTNRMSPTEFSNYLKQRGISQQQMPNPIGQPPNHYGPIGSISPSRSISPNSFAASMQSATDPKLFFSNLQSMQQSMYPAAAAAVTNFGGGSPRANGYTENSFMGGNNGGPVDPLHLYTNGPKMQQQSAAISPGQPGMANGPNGGNGATPPGDNSKLIDGLNTYYSSNAGSYHHLLVAN